MLPTDKAENAILLFNGRNKFAEYHKDKFFTQQYLKCMGTDGCNSFHLYILSSAYEIKEGDNHNWFYHEMEGVVFIDYIKKEHCLCNNKGLDFFIGSLKKVIASTDSSLKLYESETIANSAGFSLNTDDICIPSIPQSFIDRYVSEYNKGNKIEEVMVEYDSDLIIQGEKDSFNYDDGKKLNTNVGKLKLNSDNTINITFIKDSWTREEVIDLCANAYETGRRSTVISDIELLFSKWVESNL
jgi:hypothetical protein